ncbi:MAG: hypothetical protein LBC94_03235 [Desulfovibrio sp.]|nr:hypothetical protein [Desulfovibrio sp.]
MEKYLVCKIVALGLPEGDQGDKNFTVELPGDRHKNFNTHTDDNVLVGRLALGEFVYVPGILKEKTSGQKGDGTTDWAADFGVSNFSDKGFLLESSIPLTSEDIVTRVISREQAERLSLEHSVLFETYWTVGDALEQLASCGYRGGDSAEDHDVRKLWDEGVFDAISDGLDDQVISSGNEWIERKIVALKNEEEDSPAPR